MYFHNIGLTKSDLTFSFIASVEKGAGGSRVIKFVHIVDKSGVIRRVKKDFATFYAAIK